MIGIGLATCGRPSYAAAAYASITEHMPAGCLLTVEEDVKRAGVATVKNKLLSRLLDDGCEWLFLCEDDVRVVSPLAVTGYIAAAEAENVKHLMFHGHGPHNPAPLLNLGLVTVWPNWVGAWALYHRDALLDVGLMDENFVNAYEHVEHSLRLAQAGHTVPMLGAADATGSEAWLQEQPGSFETSVIRNDPHWLEKTQAARAYWEATYPDTYRMVFK